MPLDVGIGAKQQTLTVGELARIATKCAKEHPERKVMVMDLEGDEGEGLLNQIEWDCFDQEEGMVLLLVAGEKKHWQQCAKPVNATNYCCRLARGHLGKCYSKYAH